MSASFYVYLFVVSVVFCCGGNNTIEMSNNVNGCLLILIRHQLMFINLYLCELNECSQ